MLLLWTANVTILSVILTLQLVEMLSFYSAAWVNAAVVLLVHCCYWCSGCPCHAVTVDCSYYY